ncbi:MAG: TldD/PmbA family protein [Chloroflexi bacterium]|nr:TldD/PmbA family protein [Chloroflexota bacterium]
MVGEEKASEIIDFVLKNSQAEQSEVVIMGGRSELTRFAQSAVHQNMAEDNAVVYIKVVIGDRVGRVSTNKLDPDSLKATLQQATEQARRSAVTPHASAQAAPSSYSKLDTYDDVTAAYTPMDRVEVISKMAAVAAGYGFSASGAFTTAVEEIAVANSNGVYGYTKGTVTSLSALVASDSSYGYADAVSKSVGDIYGEALARTAAEKCLNCAHPAEVEPGEYDVILEPKAVATMLSFFASLGFGARSYQEGRSFVSGRLGQQIAGRNISLWDNGLDERGLAVPFDFEGVPKQRLDLIVDGVATGIAYDVESAALQGKQSTGHALPPDAREYTSDPLPLNLFLQPGDSSLEQMIGSIEKGLLVTRFHYTNIVHPLKAIITGMTRDGTFLIENGRIASGVKNLRFTQSILTALENVDMIGRDVSLKADDYYGASLVPALKIRNFNFTGVTEH